MFSYPAACRTKPAQALRPNLASYFRTAGNSGVGASLAGIVSQRWDWGTINLNAETALTRDHHGDLFLGAIVEGPSTWTVRPVAEIFYENEFGKEQTFSGLVGLIYRVRDNLSFDVAIRHALTGGHPANEFARA